MEAEYIECSEAASEAVFLIQLAHELGLGWKDPAMLLVKSDSQGALALVANASTKTRTKYIDIHYHYVRALAVNNVVSFAFVPTREQVADFMTKPLPRDKLQYCNAMVGLA